MVTQVDWTRANTPKIPHEPAARVVGELPCREPFVFAHTLAFLNGFSPMHDEQRIERGVLTKAMRFGEQTVAARVFQPRRVTGAEAPRLRYELVSDRPID